MCKELQTNRNLIVELYSFRIRFYFFIWVQSFLSIIFSYSFVFWLSRSLTLFLQYWIINQKSEQITQQFRQITHTLAQAYRLVVFFFNFLVAVVDIVYLKEKEKKISFFGRVRPLFRILPFSN